MSLTVFATIMLGAALQAACIIAAGAMVLRLG